MRCKAHGLELVVSSMVGPTQEEVLPPGPAQILPPGPVPSSSTCSQLCDFLPEEQQAATKQELRSDLVGPQSHDRAPLPSLHTPRSLITSLLSEPHAPAKLQDDDLAAAHHRAFLISLLSQGQHALALKLSRDTVVKFFLPSSRGKDIMQSLTSFLLSALDPGSLDIQLYDSLTEEQLAATEQELRTILVDLQGRNQAPPPSLHILRSLITGILSEPHALALKYSRFTKAVQIYQHLSYDQPKDIVDV